MNKLKNIFIEKREYIDLDNRKHRKLLPITDDYLFNKFNILANPEIIYGNSVLDLGSCIGALGYWCEYYGAKKYVGVEVQYGYFSIMKELMGNSTIQNSIQEDIEKYLLSCDSEEFDVVVLSGVLYAFLDYYGILKEVSRVSKKYICIDMIQASNGGIELIQTTINSFENGDVIGFGCAISKNSLDLIMGSLSFFNKNVDSSGLNYIGQYSKQHRYISVYEKSHSEKIISTAEKIHKGESILSKWSYYKK